MEERKSNVRAGKYKAVIIFFVFCLLFVFGAFYFKDSLLPGATDNPDVYFKDCNILEENCLDAAKCELNIYCGDGNFKTCRVYDCGNSYGVFTEDLEGKTDFKNEIMPDEEVVFATREDCSGTMKVLSEECIEGKTEMKIKLALKGECEIESFATIFENIGAQPNIFTFLGDDTYSVVSYACGDITKVIPAAKGGIGLELEMIND
ncbi:MAG: hypothetical protein PHX30_06565 [Candidatus Pacebacteria bacterium]|jgi:hypothetical protein|nr:hypothetical protein [Candidatus Paceibacterota bacterium]